jgi:hypothetical protein
MSYVFYILRHYKQLFRKTDAVLLKASVRSKLHETNSSYLLLFHRQFEVHQVDLQCVFNFSAWKQANETLTFTNSLLRSSWCKFMVYCLGLFSNFFFSINDCFTLTKKRNALSYSFIKYFKLQSFLVVRMGFQEALFKL